MYYKFTCLYISCVIFERANFDEVKGEQIEVELQDGIREDTRDSETPPGGICLMQNQQNLTNSVSNSSETYLKGGFVLHEVEDENCLSQAMQSNVKELVDVLIFKESELADYVVKKECINEDECNDIRRANCRKRQVRSVILLVKTRSFDKMKSFLDCAKKFCPDIVHNIWKQYQENLNQNQMSKHDCPLCQIELCVDVHCIVDDLWSDGVLDDATVREINACGDLTGQQKRYWKRIIESCNNKNACSALCKALESKGNYSHIADSLRSHFGPNKSKRTIKCICFSSKKLKIRSRASSINSDTTEYPTSSHSEDHSSEVETCDGQNGGTLEHSAHAKEPWTRPFSTNTFDPPKMSTARKRKTGSTSIFRRLFACGQSRQSIEEEGEEGEEEEEEEEEETD